MLKYQKAKQKIMEQVHDLRAGQALPPVRTLIKELGYSQITLKRAFDELEEEGILKRETGAGIFVAESEKNQRLVGVLLPYLVHKMYSQLLSGIQEVLTENNRELLLLPGFTEDYEHLYKSIKDNKLANIIVNPSSAELSDIKFINFMQRLADEGINILVIDIPVPGLRADYIGYDNVSAFSKLSKCLIDKGAKNIVVVGRFDSKVYSSRVKGIREGIDSEGVKIKQIDISDLPLRSIAKEIAESEIDALILCDAGSSIILAYEMKNILGNEMNKIQIGGIVEQDENLPFEHAVTLEKKNILMGRKAAEMLLNKQDRLEVELLSLKMII